MVKTHERALAVDRIASPIGTVLLVADEAAILAIEFDDCEARLRQLVGRYYGPHRLRPARDPGGFSRPISAYFEGELTAIEGLPVGGGGTAFQREVWAALRQIPLGETTSYGALAAKLGRPQASRAVGLANGSNPVSIVVPCHRVIGANGALTGYGGGLARKRWLLAHEGAAVAA